MQLTPQGSEGAWDVDTWSDKPEDIARVMQEVKEGQIKQAKKNVKLRERLIAIAKEAAKNGVI